jgi:uncharacterized protein YmfQ (DUF2313 family)
MAKTKEEIAESLKKYFISGVLHDAINIITTNIYKMFKAFSGSFKREYDAEEYLKRELNPETTYDLIEDWEGDVGIPDECFLTTGIDVVQRRNQVITKLTAQVQTAQDFVDLAAKLGVDVTVTAKNEGAGGFPYQFPFQFQGVEDNFVIIVDIIGWSPAGGFPYQFPFQFGFDQYSSQIQCLFDKLKPANCDIEYI